LQIRADEAGAASDQDHARAYMSRTNVMKERRHE
jgi:hypothetical protein